MSSHEIRQNRVTREWVIYSRARQKRPHEYESVRNNPERSVPPRLDPGCPFCPGSEQSLLPPILEKKNAAGEWIVRVVPNKFPALTPDGSGLRSEHGVSIALEGFGRHEVIIESPRHDRRLQDRSRDEMAALIGTYLDRSRELLSLPGIMAVILFRNHGPLAGTSLVHPHSQVIATNVVPRHIRSRQEEALRYFDEQGRCVYCDMLAFERGEGRRVVFENRSFLAFVPFAADSPFEIWIMPLNHAADFGSIGSLEQEDFGEALQQCLSRLSRKLGDPSYNYAINAATRFRERAPHLHWYLRIRPRLITTAGFEMGSGMSINPSFPEDDADFLNGEQQE